MKKKIIFIHFNRFLNNFDWERYEFDLLSKNFDIRVHILLNIVHPKLKNIRQPTKSINKNIVIFNNFKEWKNHLIKLEKNTQFVFQTFPYNFSALRIYHYVKFLNFCTSIIFMNNLPTNTAKINKNNFLSKIWKKLILAYNRPKHTIAFYKRKFIYFLFIIFPKLLSPNYCFSSGLHLKNFKFSKLIRINSWDYSRTLRNKKINIKKNSYILYISDGENRYESDSSFYNTKRTENRRVYLKKLNSFFKKIEKEFKKKIIIANHPRGNPNLKYDKDFNMRRSYYGLTYELVKNSKFVIAFNSTSLSYAILKKKKIIFFYSSSQSPINDISFNKNYSNTIKSEIVDIDSYNDLEKKFTLSIDNFAYENFKKKYLVSAKAMPNYLFFTKAFK